jgi:hypothetical protein
MKKDFDFLAGSAFGVLIPGVIQIKYLLDNCTRFHLEFTSDLSSTGIDLWDI